MDCNDNKSNNQSRLITYEPKLDSLEWLLPEMGEDLAQCKEHEPLWRKVEVRGTDIYKEHATSGEMLLIGIDAVISGNHIKYKLPNGDIEQEMYFIDPSLLSNEQIMTE